MVPAYSLTFISPSEAEKFLKENPNAIRLNRENTTKTDGVNRALDAYQLNWTLGTRITNDALRYETVSELMYFGAPSEPKLDVQYAKEGTAVTNVVIAVVQSTTDASCYLTSGGLGKNNIAFTIIGYDTWFWKWDVKVYALTL
ncbi:uncharacterized protein LOC111518988 [Drosophila willistoni]|uniref:uncharacterized protein LOC111518988 n=1 Tax=Drosophila willistoni TaxID=7260 RepID=UPI001F082556|nr:uncharacterized protein LOC111518988 [Drosophila willistoni]